MITAGGQRQHVAIGRAIVRQGWQANLLVAGFIGSPQVNLIEAWGAKINGTAPD